MVSAGTRVKRRILLTAWSLTAGALVLACAGYVLRDHLILLGLTLWVRHIDHATIELVAFDAEGHRLDSAAALRHWKPALIVRDRRDSPVFGMQFGLGIPRIAVPLGEPVTIELLWEVPGFGKVLLDANNEGRGYAPDTRQNLTIELLPELLRSRVFELNEWVASHNRGAFTSAAAGADIAWASSRLRELPSLADARQRAMMSFDALKVVLHASEDEVLAEAREIIRTRRRGSLRIKVEDAEGRPVPHAAIDLRQRRFDFLFGVFSDRYDQATLARLKAIGINYLIAFMTWNRTEPTPGTFSLDDFDRFFALPGLSDESFTVCAHALVWLANGEVPAYMDRIRGRPESLANAVREHIGGLIGRYGRNVHIWEAINEGHPQWSRWGLDDEGLTLVAKTAAQEIRKAIPAAPIMIEVTLPLGEDVALKHYPFIGLVSRGRIGAAASDPYDYLERLSRAGVPYDVVALQIYNGAWVNVAGGMQVPAIDLFRYARILDRYGKLGKALQVAEIAVSSTHRGTPSESWWHAPGNEETQADYLEGVFTLAYGDLQVQGINWWGFSDDYRFVEAGGLFDGGHVPKRAALRLAGLLDRWRGTGQLVSDDDGSAFFEGAAGDYDVTTHLVAESLEARTHISEGATTTLFVRPPSKVASIPASR